MSNHPRIPKAEFEIRGEKIDIVKQFSYLGVILTPQLSFACHARALVSKARARIAYLFMSLPLRKMSLEIVLKIFETYLLPVFSYCAPIWTYNLNGNSIQSMNSVFTSYLKRYLGLPKYSHNAAVHYYCKTWPLYNAVKFAARNAVSRIQFPANSLDGLQLSFAIESYVPPYVPSAEMYDDFPRREVFVSRNEHYRTRTFRKLFNTDHYKYCANAKFHVKIEAECKCLFCGGRSSRDHKCPTN